MTGRKKSSAVCPKMKTKRAAKKRLTVTASGFIKFAPRGKKHNLSNKSRKRNRQLVKGRYLTSGDVRIVERCIPYL